MSGEEQMPERPDANVFERIKRVNSTGKEYWTSRDLSIEIEYADYRNLEKVIADARAACSGSGQPVDNHFVDVTDMVDIGSGAKRQISNINLSRYACYLVIQNADPSKPVVALGQTYFAVQTRRQELGDEALEEERRLMLREEMKSHNKNLAGVAKAAGVASGLDFAIFQNHGYEGLYGGLDKQDIQRGKGLEKNKDILDHMGSTELAANLFRATQTEDKLRRDKIQGKDSANRTHREVGAKVRKAIADIGGIMPESLPTAENIKSIEKRYKKRQKAIED